MSTGKTSRNVEKEVVPKLNVLIQEMNPGYGLESDKIHHEADADELQIHSMLQRAGAAQAAWFQDEFQFQGSLSLPGFFPEPS